MSPVHPITICSCEEERERMPEIIAAWPYRAANDHGEVVAGSADSLAAAASGSKGLVGGVGGGLSILLVGREFSVAMMGR